MDTLLIPCFNRPEFLWYCLDNITKARGIETVHVIFSPDHGHSRDIHTVIREYTPRLASYEVRTVPPFKHRLTKQSHNVLTGYDLAAQKSTGLVFMVEEDVMVGRDFFEYHRAIHAAEPDLFCSLSTKNHNRAVTTEADPSAYYLTTLDYCSLGVCFKKERVMDFLRHATEGYYRNPTTYCQATFSSIIQRSMVEQDGLIRRVQEAQGPASPIAYPHVPRAFHAGYYGYNRTRPPGGSLEKKIYQTGIIIYDPQAMRVASRGYADSEPVPLGIPAWTTLQRRQPPELQHFDFSARP